MYKSKATTIFIAAILCVATMAIFSSRDSSAQSGSTNAEACVRIDEATGKVTNQCSEPIELFYCSQPNCGGQRYYGAWQNLEAGSSFSIPVRSLDGLVFGACPGYYFTAAHTNGRAYTCTQDIRLSHSDSKSSNEKAANAPMCRESSPASGLTKNRPVTITGKCIDGSTPVYAIEFLDERALRIMVEGGPVITLRNTKSEINGQATFLVDWRAIGKKVCAAGPTSDFRTSVVSALTKLIVSKKPSSGYRASEKIACIGVRG